MVAAMAAVAFVVAAAPFGCGVVVGAVHVQAGMAARSLASTAEHNTPFWPVAFGYGPGGTPRT